MAFGLIVQKNSQLPNVSQLRKPQHSFANEQFSELEKLDGDEAQPKNKPAHHWNGEVVVEFQRHQFRHRAGEAAEQSHTDEVEAQHSFRTQVEPGAKRADGKASSRAVQGLAWEDLHAAFAAENASQRRNRVTQG